MFYDSNSLTSTNKSSINKDTIVEIFRSSNRPLSIKEISSSINSINRYKSAEYIIIRSLRLLSNEGILCFKNGKWSIAETEEDQFNEPIEKRQNAVVYPNLSELGLAALNYTKSSSPFISSKQHNPIAESLPNRTSSIIKNINNSGPWSKFRKIVAYYKECIRNEQGADASAFLNEYGKRFLYFSEIGEWYPKPGRPWCHSIPIGPHLTELVKELGKIGEGAVVVLGYPLQAVYIKKENEPETAILRPIFQYILKTNFSLT